MITLTIILLAIPVILVIALFSRKGIAAEASILINKPRQQVFDYLAMLKNQEKFNAWLMLDPNTPKTDSGTDGQPNFILSWDSKNKKEGKASQRILSVNPPESIEIELIFEKPMPSIAQYRFELHPESDNQTTVYWRYKGNTTPYYLLRVSHLLFQLRKRVTNYMKTSLGNLKNILESE